MKQNMWFMPSWRTKIGTAMMTFIKHHKTCLRNMKLQCCENEKGVALSNQTSIDSALREI